MNLHRSSGRWRLGLALALFTSLIWGGLPIGLKILLNSLDPYTITWSRFLAAGLILAVAGGLKQRPTSWRIGRGYLLLLFIAVLGMCGNYLLYMLGLGFISPSTAQLVIQLAPIFLMVGSLLFFKERFAPLQWLGFAVLFVGMLLYFNDRLGELLFGLRELTTGVLFILAAAVSWAAYALSQKQLLGSLHPNFILLLLYLIGALPLWPLATPSRLLDQSISQLLLLLATALATLLSYRSFAGALQHMEGSRVSIVISLTPLITLAGMTMVAPFFPNLIIPDTLNPLSLLGALLVVTGSIVTALARKP
ncbi:MAG: DMT family transporter [Gemmatimonadetes bacterium]|nr:DMT family transporter [Gemmatimonadota bacterium]